MMRTRRLLELAVYMLATAMLAACGSDGAKQPFFVNCGDGTIVPPENCDLGPLDSDTGACVTVCVKATCGDGFVWEGVEQCDTNNLDNQTCQSLGYSGGELHCFECAFDVSQCGPANTPTATPPPTGTPTATPTPTITPSGPTPTPGVCQPSTTTQTVKVAYQPPSGSTATSIRIALVYAGRIVTLPADGVRDRVSTTQPRTSVTSITNMDDTLRARVLGQSGTTLAPGPVLNVVFNRCTGAPPRSTPTSTAPSRNACRACKTARVRQL
jgi:hypothetical protein